MWRHVRVYQYDSAGNVASETWYATAQDAEDAENAQNTIVYQRDSAGRITSESDAVSSVAHVYDSAGRIASTIQSSVGGPTVVLAYQYDSAGRRTQMAATIDGTADFVDDCIYDSLGRVVSINEHGVTGGNAVALKEIDLAYNTANQIVSIDRYESGQVAVEGDYSYDTSGRLVGLIYHQGTTVLNSYAWTYSGVSATAVPIPNPQSLIPSPWLPTGGLMTIHDTSGVTAALASGGLAGLDLLTGVTSSDGTATYTYDATGQLIGVTYSSSNPQSLNPNPSESYSYDANGNRVGATAGSSSSAYVTGAGNRLLSDGTYTYAYDAEGNRTARFIDMDQDEVLDTGDTQLTEYTWDARNRLVEVTERATVGSAATKAVDLYYDVEDRWIGENIDSNGDGVFDHATRFAYDGNQIALQFDKDVSGAPGSANALTVADLSHRYLWEPGVVDQLLADERTQLGANGDVATDELLWALTDQQGTVRDVARSDGTTTTVVNHVVYESYGTIVSQSDSTQGTLFGFTSRPLDTATGLQNNWHRWYTDVGCWLSQDPMGFTAGDTNTASYVGNSPTNATDPTGLAWQVDRDKDQPRATVTSNGSSTIAELAAILHLDAKEFALWLRRVPTDDGPFPRDENAIVESGRTFTVPNRVFVYIAERGTWDFSQAASICRTRAHDAGETLKAQNYNVTEVTTSNANVFRRFWADRDIIGFLFGGHGSESDGVVVDGRTGDAIKPGEVRRKAYKLAVVGMFACYSSDPLEPVNAGDAWYWSDHVADGGLFLGWTGPLRAEDVLKLRFHTKKPNFPSIQAR